MFSRFFFSGLISLLLFSNRDIKAQSISRENYTGYWADSASWIGNGYPGTSILKNDVYCNGYLTALSCIDINLAGIYVHDTLVVNGNLYLKNKSYLQVDTGAVLLIFGDIEINNQAQVLNSGTIVVAGSFSILGSQNRGSFMNFGGKVFIFDPFPEYPEGNNYSDLFCNNPEKYPDSCGYGIKKDLPISGFSSFYNALPFSKRIISTDGNDCFSYEVTTTETEICAGDTSIYNFISTNVYPSDSIIWNFGDDATPNIAYGFGPQEVIYTTAGQKSVHLTIISDTALQIDVPNIVTVNDLPQTGDIYLASVSAGSHLNYIDVICENATREYTVQYHASSTYRWIIPSLNIDTTGSSHLVSQWNIGQGEYNITVQETSLAGCAGAISEAIILVNECIEERIFDRMNYAFSPNGDGINDTWVIENIENYPEAKIYVYNKTGKLIFKSESNYMSDWDGTDNGGKLPLDSYYFIIDLNRYNKGQLRGILTILPVDLLQ
jgi:gliding motility-associated-like protein